MRGQCAVFIKDDEQIGGCYDWLCEISTVKALGNRHSVTTKIVTTAEWWLDKFFRDFAIKLFWVIEGEAVFVDEFVVGTRLKESLVGLNNTKLELYEVGNG